MENRRDFIRKTGATAAGIALGGATLSAKSYRRVLGANDRLNIAVVGCLRRANAMRSSFGELKDHLSILYACDVVRQRREEYAASLREPMGESPEAVNDFREALDDDRVDAIFNLTPDHWHGPGSYMALKAGKHVYVEKPLTHNPHEGELFHAFQKKYGKVVFMGTQQRSQETVRKIIGEIHDGLIGEVYQVVGYYANQRGSIGNGKQVPVPEGFDWDLFQGPAPRKPYLDILYDYNWHWFWNWGTGETGNNATHEMDLARWILKVDHPRRVQCNAGKYHHVDDDWTMYDTMDVIFRYPGNKSIRWDGRSRSNYRTYGDGRGNIVYGSEGTVTISRNGYKVYDLKNNLLREEDEGTVSVTTGLGGGGGITTKHIANFIGTVRGTAEPHSVLKEADASSHLNHLANIAYRTGKDLEVDSATGEILDRDIRRRFWARQYEPGWEPKI